MNKTEYLRVLVKLGVITEAEMQKKLEDGKPITEGLLVTNEITKDGDKQ